MKKCADCGRPYNIYSRILELDACQPCATRRRRGQTPAKPQAHKLGRPKGKAQKCDWCPEYFTRRNPPVPIALFDVGYDVHKDCVNEVIEAAKKGII